MYHTRLKKICGILLAVIYVFIMKEIPLSLIQAVPEKINLNQSDVIAVNEEAIFGKYISLETSKTTEKERDTVNLNFKLFGILPIRTVSANVVEEKKIYVGGQPVGFSLSSEGLIVVGSNSVLTEHGKVNTLEHSNLKVGDIIKEIAGEKINSVTDAERIINKQENQNKELNVKIVRKQKEMQVTLKPALDMQSERYKMGLWVRDDAAGVGTLTYIRKDNNRFGALGHPICDIDTKVPFSIDDGKIYESTIIGVKRGRKGIPGELKGLFIRTQQEEGTVDKNMEFGVFGTVQEESEFLEEENLLEIGGRLTARPGKAKIRVTTEGQKVEEYDIEIIKTNYQNISKQKSMVIRVTDKELLEKTGGIVQGMSGSPIIQNGKVIGAVTHVFVNDPKKGFGVYLDWMNNE